MVGQYTRNGYTRNFAYRFRNTVMTSPMDDGHVIELNPVLRDTVIDSNLIVQMKDSGIQVIRHVNGLFENITEEVASFQDGRD